MKSPQLKLEINSPRRRPASLCPDLCDGDIFPFGWHRHEGVRMVDVDLKWWRWFMEQHWAHKWPGMQRYALRKLGPE